MKGGYQIISLKSKTLYDDIEKNLYKPLLLTDIVIDDVDKPDLFIKIEVWNSNFIIECYDKTITITSENQVTMTNGGLHLYHHFLNIELGDDDESENNGGSLFLNVYTNDEKEININSFKALLSRGFKYICNGGVNIGGFPYASYIEKSASIDWDCFVQVSIGGEYKDTSYYAYKITSIYDSVIQIY